jgi:hypothetical protein
MERISIRRQQNQAQLDEEERLHREAQEAKNNKISYERSSGSDSNNDEEESKQHV